MLEWASALEHVALWTSGGFQFPLRCCKKYCPGAPVQNEWFHWNIYLNFWHGGTGSSPTSAVFIRACQNFLSCFPVSQITWVGPDALLTRRNESAVRQEMWRPQHECPKPLGHIFWTRSIKQTWHATHMLSLGWVVFRLSLVCVVFRLGLSALWFPAILKFKSVYLYTWPLMPLEEKDVLKSSTKFRNENFIVCAMSLIKRSKKQ